MIGPYPTVWMGHYVHEPGTRPATGYPALRPDQLASLLDEVGRTGTPVGWPEVRDAIQGHSELPRDAVLLTFDDGLMDHFRTVLPALVAREIPAVFFALAREPRDGLALGHQLHVLLGVMSPSELGEAVAERLPRAARADYRAQVHAELRRGLAAGSDAHDAADPWKRPLQRDLADVAGPVLSALVRERLGPEDDLARELYLGKRELAEIAAAGHTIGGHGRDHPWLDVVDLAARRREVAASAELAAAYSSGSWPFAYPYGGVPPRAGDLLRKAGFTAAFTTSPRERRGAFRIGRYDVDAGTTSWTGTPTR